MKFQGRVRIRAYDPRDGSIVDHHARNDLTTKGAAGIAARLFTENGAALGSNTRLYASPGQTGAHVAFGAMQGSPAVSAGAVVYTFQKNADAMGATIATPWLHLKAVDTVAGDAWFSLPGSRFNPAITALDHNKSYTVTWTVSAEILIVSSGVAELLGYSVLRSRNNIINRLVGTARYPHFANATIERVQLTLAAINANPNDGDITDNPSRSQVERISQIVNVPVSAATTGSPAVVTGGFNVGPFEYPAIPQRSNVGGAEGPSDTQVEASLAQWFGVFFTQGPTAIKVGNVRVGGLFPPVTTKDSATAGITLSGTIA